MSSEIDEHIERVLRRETPAGVAHMREYVGYMKTFARALRAESPGDLVGEPAMRFADEYIRALLTKHEKKQSVIKIVQTHMRLFRKLGVFHEMSPETKVLYEQTRQAKRREVPALRQQALRGKAELFRSISSTAAVDAATRWLFRVSAEEFRVQVQRCIELGVAPQKDLRVLLNMHPEEQRLQRLKVRAMAAIAAVTGVRGVAFWRHVSETDMHLGLDATDQDEVVARLAYGSKKNGKSEDQKRMHVVGIARHADPELDPVIAYCQFMHALPESKRRRPFCYAEGCELRSAEDEFKYRAQRFLKQAEKIAGRAAIRLISHEVASLTHSTGDDLYATLEARLTSRFPELAAALAKNRPKAFSSRLLAFRNNLRQRASDVLLVALHAAGISLRRHDKKLHLFRSYVSILLWQQGVDGAQRAEHLGWTDKSGSKVETQNYLPSAAEMLDFGVDGGQQNQSPLRLARRAPGQRAPALWGYLEHAKKFAGDKYAQVVWLAEAGRAAPAALFDASSEQLAVQQAIETEDHQQKKLLQQRRPEDLRRKIRELNVLLLKQTQAKRQRMDPIAQIDELIEEKLRDRGDSGFPETCAAFCRDHLMGILDAHSDPELDAYLGLRPTPEQKKTVRKIMVVVKLGALDAEGRARCAAKRLRAEWISWGTKDTVTLNGCFEHRKADWKLWRHYFIK